MPAIRNSAVAQGIVADTTFHTVYTVPASTNFILKSILVSQQSGGAVTVTVTIHDQVSGANIEAALIADAAGQPGSWSGWVVLNTGNTIILNASVANTYYWISGAVLPFVGAGP